MNSLDYENAAILTPKRTMEIVLDTISEVVPYELGVILSLEMDNILKVRYAQGNLFTPRIRDYSISLDKRPDLAKILKAGKVHLFKEDEDHIDTYEEILELPAEHSCMVAPLHIEGKLLGMLTLDHRKCNTFSTKAVDITKALARIIALALAQSIAADELLVERDALIYERNTLLQDLSHTLDGMIGNSPAWLKVLEKIKLVSTTDSPVMIMGETGTGKEKVARAIHSLSFRANKSFVALNCSALMNNLAESELFGHERGAFTGAISRRKGRFELANNGTLFLDEVGDLPLAIQPKLLRALQEGTFERVGGETSIYSDARIICATNINLKQALQQKSFREDLFYRLNVFPIHLPPLRERGDDIILLADYFLKKITKRLGKKLQLSSSSIHYLLQHGWPGNVRELQNTIERAAIVAKDIVQPQHLDIQQIIPSDTHVATKTTYICPLNDAIRTHITEALENCQGKIYGQDGAAQLLGVKPTTLQSKMRKLGIKNSHK